MVVFRKALPLQEGRFTAFCKGWCDGFTTITASNGERTEAVEAFYTDYTRKWTPVDSYIKNPLHPAYIPDKYIKEKKAVTEKTRVPYEEGGAE